MKQLCTLLLVFLSLVLAGCGGDSEDARTKVRIIHASADAPPVNVKVNSRTVAEGADYTQAAQISREAVATVTVDAQLPGGQTATVIGPASIDLINQERVDVIAVGKVADDSLTALVLSDAGELSDTSMVRVRVAHLAPDAPAVDVYVTAPGTALDAAEPLGSFSFKGTLGPVEVVPGDYRIRVTAADSSSVLYDSGTVALTAGNDLLIGAIPNTGAGDAPIALALYNEGDSSVIYDTDDGAGLRVVHDSVDAPAVDVYLNSALAIEDLAFPNVAPGADSYAPAPAGSNQVQVTAANTTADSAVIDATLTLDNGQPYTVLAVNTLSNIEALVLEDNNRSIATEARLRVVHGSTNAGNVDVYLVEQGAGIGNSDPALTDVPFKANSGYLSVAAGDYDIIVAPAGTGTAAIGPVSVSLAAGGVYTVVARDGNTDTGDTFGVITLDDF
ncbi:DUF4397 domain-containing protein [Marinobacteraceae bacterium S3BR75-40.1]